MAPNRIPAAPEEVVTGRRSEGGGSDAGGRPVGGLEAGAGAGGSGGRSVGGVEAGAGGRPAGAPKAGTPATDTPATGDPEPSRGGRPRDDAREQAILEAATDLLAEVGYEALSIEGVATRAGSSKATIYRRWPGKAELVADALRRRHEPEAFDIADTGSLRGDLLAAVGVMLDNMAGMDGGLICGLAVAVRSDAELGRTLSAQKAEYKKQLASLVISRAQRRGELPDQVDPAALTDVAPAVALFRHMNGEPLDAGFAEHLVDRVIIPLLRS
jgi:AcrR family transcriptional regulator